MSESASITLEALLAQVEVLPQGATSLELFVPNEVTWEGQPVPQDVAMAIVVDKLLARDLYPVGFEQRPTGRRYQYTSELPAVDAEGDDA